MRRLSYCPVSGLNNENFDILGEQTVNSVVLDESPAFLRFKQQSVSNSSLNHVDSSEEDIILSTYQLDKNHPSVRVGSIQLLSSDDLSVKHKIRTNGGVFRFDLVPGQSKVVAALTSGRVSYVDYATHQQHSSGILSGGLILNASWNVNTSKIICSDEYGELIVLEAESLAMNRHWLAHKSKYGLAVCEVWTCSWLDATTAVSGADDGLIRIWDIRAEQRPQAQNASHESGVVFVDAYKSCSNLLMSGSYDEHLRLFDTRNFAQPLLEHKLDGGVWYVEQMEIAGDDEFLLAACMYGGWTVVLKTSEFSTLHCSNEPGENLLYGASSKRLCDRRYLIASCTFNDNQVRLSNITLNV